MTDVSTASAESVDHLPARLVVAAALAALADGLFYGHRLGLSVALFILVLAVVLLCANPTAVERRRLLEAGAILAAAMLPLVEAPTTLAFLIAIAGTAYFVLAATPSMPERLFARVTAALCWLATAPFQIFADLPRVWASVRQGTTLANVLVAWVVPIGLGAIFVGLFAAANPVIEDWLAALAWRDSAGRVDPARVMFWLAMIALAWPFVHINKRFNEQAQSLVPGLETQPSALPEGLFGRAAIVRSLVLFNLLFAVQTVMDLNYLWRGAELPHGVSHAEYAHRGAYPLIVTALLAAAFVIAAMRPGGGAERSRLIRTLVFVWTGQNVMLVVSSILRLDLYVAMYSLTYWRAAAFVWMLLVAVGLVLIVARIVLDRSDAWLIGTNLTALMLTLYVCAFINFPHVIAMYNVEHSREVSGQGETLDVNYLACLGPDALPAIDSYVAHQPALGTYFLGGRRASLTASHLATMEDWRAWSFRGWRLKRYLETRAAAAPTP